MTGIIQEKEEKIMIQAHERFWDNVLERCKQLGFIA